ncbi:hypothetical protein RGF97_01595 [Streptomyces roseicoloratus]|uniref:Outer membrane channel protein CpnT-like N-terminal domain-containing protein n=1 Tax=Streptomyces roseicoloratus TaxID=2508722 RepID=A0ABY9RQ62_9ACTN|nr:hypothetical protein [Streptomyces roseicoloratus]WMX43819.1 hypothetical protein RGF97_01595 [Streptomyces roseicoloratus]
MSLEFPPECAWLFAALTGEVPPNGDEDKLFALAEVHKDLHGKLTNDLKQQISEALGYTHDAFKGNAAEMYQAAMKSFIGEEGLNYFDAVADQAKLLADFSRKGGTQLQYTKYMIIAQLVELLVEAIVAAATAFFFGASLQAYFAKVAFVRWLIKFRLGRLVLMLITHQIINVGMGVAMDVLVQWAQLNQGTRDEFDTNLTKQAALSGMVQGLLAGPFQFLGNKFGRGLANLFGKNSGKNIGNRLDEVFKPRKPDLPGPRKPDLAGPKKPSPPDPDAPRTFGDDIAKNFGDHLPKTAGPKRVSDKAAKDFVTSVGDTFDRHLKRDGAREAGENWARTLLRDTGKKDLPLNLEKSLGPLGKDLGPDVTKVLTRGTADAMGQSMLRHWSQLGVLHLGKGVFDGAHAAVSEGMYNLIFSDEHTFKTSGLTFGSGMVEGRLSHGLELGGERLGNTMRHQLLNGGMDTSGGLVSGGTDGSSGSAVSGGSAGSAGSGDSGASAGSAPSGASDGTPRPETVSEDRSDVGDAGDAGDLGSVGDLGAVDLDESTTPAGGDTKDAPTHVNLRMESDDLGSDSRTETPASAPIGPAPMAPASQPGGSPTTAPNSSASASTSPPASSSAPNQANSPNASPSKAEQPSGARKEASAPDTQAPAGQPSQSIATTSGADGASSGSSFSSSPVQDLVEPPVQPQENSGPEFSTVTEEEELASPAPDRTALATVSEGVGVDGNDYGDDTDEDGDLQYLEPWNGDEPPLSPREQGTTSGVHDPAGGEAASPRTAQEHAHATPADEPGAETRLAPGGPLVGPSSKAPLVTAGTSETTETSATTETTGVPETTEVPENSSRVNLLSLHLLRDQWTALLSDPATAADLLAEVADTRHSPGGTWHTMDVHTYRELRSRLPEQERSDLPAESVEEAFSGYSRQKTDQRHDRVEAVAALVQDLHTDAQKGPLRSDVQILLQRLLLDHGLPPARLPDAARTTTFWTGNKLHVLAAELALGMADVTHVGDARLTGTLTVAPAATPTDATLSALFPDAQENQRTLLRELLDGPHRPESPWHVLDGDAYLALRTRFGGGESGEDDPNVRTSVNDVFEAHRKALETATTRVDQLKAVADTVLKLHVTGGLPGSPESALTVHSRFVVPRMLLDLGIAPVRLPDKLHRESSWQAARNAAMRQNRVLTFATSVADAFLGTLPPSTTCSPRPPPRPMQQRPPRPASRVPTTASAPPRPSRPSTRRRPLRRTGGLAAGAGTSPPHRGTGARNWTPSARARTRRPPPIWCSPNHPRTGGPGRPTAAHRRPAVLDPRQATAARHGALAGGTGPRRAGRRHRDRPAAGRQGPADDGDAHRSGGRDRRRPASRTRTSAPGSSRRPLPLAVLSRVGQALYANPDLDEDHSVVRTAVRLAYAEASRDAERALGEYLTRHPDVQEQVRTLVRAAWDRLPADKRAELGTERNTGSGSVGDDPRTLQEVVEHGNIRERMHLLVTGVHGPLMKRLVGPKPTPAILTRERSGPGVPANQRIQQDADVVQNIRRAQERLRREQADNPGLEALLAAQEHDRRTPLRPEDAVPPLSTRERAHVVENGRLTWEPGERHRQILLMSVSQVTAEATGGLMSAGTSNTAYFTLKVVHKMATTWNVPVDFQLVRLALMADMLPVGHHTFHEIMTASEAFEQDVLVPPKPPRGAPSYVPVLSYTDNWGRFRSLPPLTESQLREAMPDGRFPDEVALGLEAHERTPDTDRFPLVEPPARRSPGRTSPPGVKKPTDPSGRTSPPSRTSRMSPPNPTAGQTSLPSPTVLSGTGSTACGTTSTSSCNACSTVPRPSPAPTPPPKPTPPPIRHRRLPPAPPARRSPAAPPGPCVPGRAGAEAGAHRGAAGVPWHAHGRGEHRTLRPEGGTEGARRTVGGRRRKTERFVDSDPSPCAPGPASRWPHGAAVLRDTAVQADGRPVGGRPRPAASASPDGSGQPCQRRLPTPRLG